MKHIYIGFFIALFLTSINLSAQWNTDTAINTLVANSESNDMQAIGTTQGQTYIVFWKSVGAPTNFELRLQVLDALGNQQLGDEGALISNSIPMNTFTVTWSLSTDADDNLYIGVTGTADNSAHAFKLDINGNHLWGTEGIVLGNGFNVNILALDNGDAIVAWFPQGQGLMQRYDVEGNAVWISPQMVESGSAPTVPANLFEISNGDYIVIFHVLSFGINSTLYAQRYDANGVAQWASPTQLSDKTTAFNTQYSGTQDGDIIYYAYVGKTATRFDSFVIRLNPDGTLPWGINGMDFDVNETDYEMDTRIAVSQNSPNLWAICTYTNQAQSERGEYVQKFDKETGERQLTDNAKIIYAISNEFNEHSSDLYIVNEQVFFLLKSGFDDGTTPVSLSTVLLDENGDFAWTEESKPVATYEANKDRVNLTKPVNGQAVAVWTEDKATGTKIYAQNFIEDLTNVSNLQNEYELIIYPNPTKNNACIKFSSPVHTKARLMIFNSIGAIVVVEEEQLLIGENSIEINAQNLSHGTYYFRIEGEDVTLFGGFLKVK